LFDAVLGNVVEEALSSSRWEVGKNISLNIVAESGHPNAQNAVGIYEEYRRKHQPEHRVILNGLTFQSKTNCLPLAAADLFAYGNYRRENSKKILGVSKKPLKADASYKGNSYRIEIGKEDLETLYSNGL
jgi:hypothetical protein